jgi:putative transcriptional regulator
MTEKIDKSKLNFVERSLIDGLEEFVGDLKKGKAIPEKYTCRSVVLDLSPRPLVPEQIKSIRKLLHASQAFFAQLIGVSPRTIAAWECGAKKPRDVALRFMSEIQNDPEYWRGRIRKSLKSKED